MLSHDHTHYNRPLPVHEWLQTIDDEYLGDFIPSGGSTVRFVGGDDDALEDAREGLAALASSRGIHLVEMDPDELDENGKKPDLHRIDKLYFQIAKTIDWRNEAGKQVVDALGHRGIRFPHDSPTTDYAEVARLSGNLEPSDLLTKYQNLITDIHLRDLGMAVEFRIALTALGRAQLIPEEITPTTEELLLGWLRGEKAFPGSAPTLKRIRIHERIGRSNAKFILQSFCHWFRQLGKPGILVVLDFRPYERVQISHAQRVQMQYAALLEAIDRGADAGELKAITDSQGEESDGVRYGHAAYIQALELLRHFIDDIEHLEGFMLVVLGSPSYFAASRLSEKERRFWDYDALRTRIGLEVHDATRQNPSAGLVHLVGGVR